MIQFSKNELTGSFDTLLADGKPYKFKTNTATIIILYPVYIEKKSQPLMIFIKIYIFIIFNLSAQILKYVNV